MNDRIVPVNFDFQPEYCTKHGIIGGAVGFGIACLLVAMEPDIIFNKTADALMAVFSFTAAGFTLGYSQRGLVFMATMSRNMCREYFFPPQPRSPAELPCPHVNRR